MGELFPAFKKDREEEVQSVLTSAVSQVTLIQNNQYATVACFGVACSEPQQ